MDHRTRSYLTFTLLITLLLVEGAAYAQQAERGYETRFRPDIWYNDVDGIRVGTRFTGRVRGTGQGGPHRLDLGAWVGLWFPSLPVSYDLRYTEPLPFFSDFENEFHIQLHSSVREGYQRHGATLRKRWQPADNFRHFYELGTGYHFQRRFDSDYVLFPDFWSESWKGMLDGFFDHQHLNSAGIFRLKLNSALNTSGPAFTTSSVTMLQQFRFPKGWQLRVRLYGEGVTGSVPPEYRPLLSTGAGVGQIAHPLFRSRGTIPVAWARSGYIHHASGANLRGYTFGDQRSLVDGSPRYYKTIGAVNMEFDIPNPIQHAINDMELTKKFLSFRSYLFSGVASASGGSEPELDGRYAEGGAGVSISLNIPDHLGRDRGFVLRYESPLWLSRPGDEGEWKWRHLFGIGAVITF